MENFIFLRSVSYTCTAALTLICVTGTQRVKEIQLRLQVIGIATYKQEISFVNKM